MYMCIVKDSLTLDETKKTGIEKIFLVYFCRESSVLRECECMAESWT